ncbi:50S ribosomal protein L5 [Candidatus Woesearchaeota archaeon]|nr:50S ribosomal protein L5 [Candidatus Woesearchaeota archaeon]
MKKTNLMRGIRIGKITLNIGTSKDDEKVKRGLKLLQKLTPLTPLKTFTKRRIPNWGLRPGLVVGCTVTIRRDAEPLLKRLLAAREYALPARSFDQNGNFSFGVPEYIDVEGLEYDPELKIMGMEVAVTLQRAGYRVKLRKIHPHAVGKLHRISAEDAIAFAQEKLGVKIGGVEK